MKHQTIIGTLSASLFLSLGCERRAVTPPASAGRFSVNSDTRMATGQALGIEFKVAGASGAEVTSELAGSPKSSSRAEITLADDLKIKLQTMDEGNSVTFRLNGKDYGRLQRGDEVAIGEDRNVMTNGEKRSDAESLPR